MKTPFGADRVKICHVIEGIAMAGGGPPAVVFNLAAQQARSGHEVSIACTADEDLSRIWRRWVDDCGIPGSVRLISVSGRSPWQDDVAGLCGRPDVFHVHGVWGRLAWSVLRSRRRGGPPVLLAPHGMLSRWSLGQKAWKKRAALALGWRAAIQAVDGVHVLNTAEQTDFHACFPELPTVIIPNGVSSLTEPASRTLSDRWSDPYVLYLARLHRMKGPERVIRAFARMVERSGGNPGVRLVMAGPDGGELPALRREVETMNIGRFVSFPGPVYGERKQTLLANAVLYCQPSRYEGFSVSLLEALAAGVPVVTTPEANFPEIGLRGAGCICDGSDEALGDVLLEILSDRELASSMGAAGRRLVAESYTWPIVSARSLEAYVELQRPLTLQRKARESRSEA